MTDAEIGLNPAVLSWARLQIGFSVEDVARRMSQTEERVQEWESGSRLPTYPQLERLAEMYKRPVAVFFFPAPPQEQSLETEFRTLRSEALERLEPDTRLAIRSARAFQASLYELTSGTNPAGTPIHQAMRNYQMRSVRELVTRVRTHLGVSIVEQRSWRGPTDAMRHWRDVVERAGIYVQKRSFRQREISGFCLHDEIFPVIVINNSTAHARQIFTLFHELGHIIYGVSSLTPRKDEGWFSDDPVRRIEVLCNEFASQFLLPAIPLTRSQLESAGLVEVISRCARDFHVSREVVLRRFLNDGLIDQSIYRHYAEEWNQDYFRTEQPRANDGKSRGHWYNMKASYLGRNYLNLAFLEYYGGRLSVSELALHLGIKEKQVARFEDYVQI